MSNFSKYRGLNHMHSFSSHGADIFSDVHCSFAKSIFRKRIDSYESPGSANTSTTKTKQALIKFTLKIIYMLRKSIPFFRNKYMYLWLRFQKSQVLGAIVSIDLVENVNTTKQIKLIVFKYNQWDINDMLDQKRR